MNESQLKHFQEILERQLEDRNQRVEEEQRLAGESPEGVNDAGDNAVRDLYSDTDLTLGSHYTDEIYAIERALDRIARDDYGKCAVCGSEIPLERLEAQPAATTCALHAPRPERPPPTL